MHLVLSRLQPSDLDEALEIQYEAFSSVDFHIALFGENTPQNRLMTKARFLADMANDASDCWLKLTDADNKNKIVSCAQWKIYPNWTGLKERKGMEIEWHEGAEEKRCAGIMCEDFMRRRESRMGDHAHVYPSYQKCGAGSTLVKWGTDLADRLMVPTWLEASPAGHHLYEENGFVDVEYVHEKTGKWLAEYTVMKREAKTSLQAGRSVTFD